MYLVNVLLALAVVARVEIRRRVLAVKYRDILGQFAVYAPYEALTADTAVCLDVKAEIICMNARIRARAPDDRHRFVEHL